MTMLTVNLQAEKESFLSENQKLAKQLKIIRESREVCTCMYMYVHVHCLLCLHIDTLYNLLMSFKQTQKWTTMANDHVGEHVCFSGYFRVFYNYV